MGFLDPSKAETELVDPEQLAKPEAPEQPADSRADLGRIEISSELASLFHEAKDLLTVVKNDPEVPANQKAQVLNSILSIIERITKTRTDLYNAERIRAIEQTLLRVMRDQPQDLKESFFEAYEASFAQ